MTGKIDMYLDDSQINRNSLIQGDIISKIHILGAINLLGINYSSSATDLNSFNSWSVSSSPKIGDAMILSHSCEIDLKNNIKVTSIILAPLRSVHTATDPKRVQDLKDSNLIDKNNPEFSYLKYFYVKPNLKLEHKDGAVVDFSKCFSVRNKSYNFLLENKIAQLKNDIISSMSLKLALYYYRSIV